MDDVLSVYVGNQYLEQMLTTISRNVMTGIKCEVPQATLVNS